VEPSFKHSISYFRAMTHRHYIVNKPLGFLSQFINNKRRKKKLLGELHDFPAGTMSIGRLDVDSEGLLLLTTNGKLSEKIRSAKYEKEYYVQVDGIIDEAAIEQLVRGVEISINGNLYQTKPCKAKIIDEPNFPVRTKKIRDDRHGPTSWASITLTEGKFRQVRKMTAVVGYPTLRLIRIRIGDLILDDLLPGQVVEVNNFVV